jgi:hypothetical protein
MDSVQVSIPPLCILPASAVKLRQEAQTAMPVTHPYQRIPPKHRDAVFLSFLALTLVLMTVLWLIDVPLKTTAAPQGIVSYELAGSVTEAQRILDSWSPTARLYAAFSLGLDYLYMPAYAIAIGLACAWAAELWSRRRRRLALAGVGLAWGLMAAALCDAIENVALITMLLSGVREPWPALAGICAAVKFLLIGAGLVIALLGALSWLRSRW